MFIFVLVLMCTQNGNTVLMLAASQGHMSVMEMLLNRGAQVDIQRKVNVFVCVFVCAVTLTLCLYLCLIACALRMITLAVQVNIFVAVLSVLCEWEVRIWFCLSSNQLFHIPITNRKGV